MERDLHGVQWKEIWMELYGKSAYVLVLVCCCFQQKVHPWMRTCFQSATSTRSSQFKSCESTKASCQDDMKTCEEGIAGKIRRKHELVFEGLSSWRRKMAKHSSSQVNYLWKLNKILFCKQNLSTVIFIKILRSFSAEILQELRDRVHRGGGGGRDRRA